MTVTAEFETGALTTSLPACLASVGKGIAAAESCPAHPVHGLRPAGFCILEVPKSADAHQDWPWCCRMSQAGSTSSSQAAATDHTHGYERSPPCALQELLGGHHELITDTGDSLFQVMKLRLPGALSRGVIEQEHGLFTPFFLRL